MENISTFITQHPVFTRNELIEFLINQGSTNSNTQIATIQYHLKQGHMVRIKQGLFAAIPPGFNILTYPIDSYLVAGKLSSDAILSYHTALEYHGLAYTVFNTLTFCTSMKLKTFSFQGRIFEAISFPNALRNTNNELFAVENIKRQGLVIRVTSLERTFVDLLDQPNHSGGWEEIFRSIETIGVLNLDLLIEYALLLKKATTIAKVGYFLEKLRITLGTTDNQLKKLQKHLPKKPHYLNRSQRKGGTFIKRWNLIIPEKIVTHQWEEQTYDD